MGGGRGATRTNFGNLEVENLTIWEFISRKRGGRGEGKDVRIYRIRGQKN